MSRTVRRFSSPSPWIAPSRFAGLAWPTASDPGEAVGHWVQERLIQSAWELFCRYDFRPPHSSECEAAYQGHHTPGESWAVDALRRIQCREDAVLALRNGRLTRFTTEGMDDEAIMAAAGARIAAEVFGMPDLPVAAALEALTQRAPAGR